MLTQRLTVESAPLPSPRWVAAAGKGGEGEEVRTGRPAWITNTGVLLATNCCCMHAGGPAWHPFLSTSASPNLAHQQQHAGSRFSRPRPHCDPALRHWDNVVWDGSPPTAMACCAWVDEVLHDSVEWWTFTQFCKFSFNTELLMLQTQRRWLASEALVSLMW